MREPLVPQFDADTYFMWESRQRDRFELHHGFVVAFAGGTLDHDRIALNLRIAFDRLFPAPCRSFGSDVKVRADVTTFYYPDAGVICDELPGDTATIETPHIVAEVLSPSTRTYDLIEKRAAYRKIGSVRAYVVVHTTQRYVEIDLRDGGDGWYTSTFDDGAFPLGIGALTLEDVYRRSSIAQT